MSEEQYDAVSKIKEMTDKKGLKISKTMKEDPFIPVFTEEDLDACWAHYKGYLIDILNNEYDLKQAREDLFGLIGSRFDKRIKSAE